MLLFEQSRTLSNCFIAVFCSAMWAFPVSMWSKIAASWLVGFLMSVSVGVFFVVLERYLYVMPAISLGGRDAMKCV